MTAILILLVLVHETLAAGVQITFKTGVDLQDDVPPGWKGYMLFVRQIFCSGAIWGGIFLTIARWILWFVILAKIDLSMAEPLDALQNVLILIAAYLFLKERFDWRRVVGVLLITTGIVIVAAS